MYPGDLLAFRQYIVITVLVCIVFVVRFLSALFFSVSVALRLV